MKDGVKQASMTKMASTSASPYWKPSKPLAAASDVITFPDFKHTELLLESRIKTEIQPALKLDADNQICKPFLSPNGCPRGAACPLRHTTPSTANYVVIPTPTTVQGRTVCKHWLRGLCKKGADCEFLHEYNLRKMPECYFFTKHGFCSSGDECMYLHITPHQRRPECRSYTAGFCRQGPSCPNKHIRKIPCPLYLVGFCPLGLECSFAHPPFLLPDVERVASHSFERDSDNPLYRHAARERDRGHHNGRPIASYMDGNMVDGDGMMGDRRPPNKNARGMVCFKCGQEGHLANQCPNPSVPGNRGGVERGPGGRPMA